MDEILKLADRCDERALRSLRDFDRMCGELGYMGKASGLRESAFQWLSIADALRARTQAQSGIDNG